MKLAFKTVIWKIMFVYYLKDNCSGNLNNSDLDVMMSEMNLQNKPENS